MRSFMFFSFGFLATTVAVILWIIVLATSALGYSLIELLQLTR